MAILIPAPAPLPGRPAGVEAPSGLGVGRRHQLRRRTMRDAPLTPACRAGPPLSALLQVQRRRRRQRCGNRPALQPHRRVSDLRYMSRKIESLERINYIRETNGSFDSCNSCKLLVPSRLHELHEWKLSFVSRIEFFRSKLSNFLLMYPGSDRPRC